MDDELGLRVLDQNSINSILEYHNVLKSSKGFVQLQIFPTIDPKFKMIIITITNDEEYQLPLEFNTVPINYVRAIAHGATALMHILVSIAATVVEAIQRDGPDRIFNENILEILNMVYIYLSKYNMFILKTGKNEIMIGDRFNGYESSSIMLM